MLDIVNLAEQSGLHVKATSTMIGETSGELRMEIHGLEAYSRALLEEAAKVCDGLSMRCATYVPKTMLADAADDIRAMLPAPTAEQEKKA